MTLLAKTGLSDLSPEHPVLIAGPTASGKSALALEIVQTQGGVIVNADASQVYDCWRIITACPSPHEEAAAPHALYRHIAWDAPYSAGHWLREVAPLLNKGLRPVIVGGTGLNFMALTHGLADIPATPPEVRMRGDALSLEALLAGLDPQTLARTDTQNRMRVQRAWEVQKSTGRSLSGWQDDTPPPLLNTGLSTCIVMAADKDWLNDRIERRFDLMMQGGAMDEIAAMADRFDPSLPSCRAIGVPELMACHNGQITEADARSRAITATRQYAKRQRTWFRSKMRDWQAVDPAALS